MQGLAKCNFKTQTLACSHVSTSTVLCFHLTMMCGIPRYGNARLTIWILSVVKASKMPHVLYVSTEMIAHGMTCHLIVVSSARGTVICLCLTVEKD